MSSNGNRAPCESGAALIASVVLLLLFLLLVDALTLRVGRRNDGRCLNAVLLLAGRVSRYLRRAVVVVVVVVAVVVVVVVVVVAVVVVA